jgi:hypothetical protein
VGGGGPTSAFSVLEAYRACFGLGRKTGQGSARDVSDDSKPGLGRGESHYDGHKLYKCAGVLPSDTVDIKKEGPPFPERKKPFISFPVRPDPPWCAPQ